MRYFDPSLIDSPYFDYEAVENPAPRCPECGRSKERVREGWVCGDLYCGWADRDPEYVDELPWYEVWKDY